MLLVQLVDAVHPRVFSEEWFQPCASKLHNVSAVTEVLKESVEAVRLIDDSAPSLRNESLRRMWERSSDSDISFLLAKESTGIESWIRELHPEGSAAQQPRRKRKALKSPQKQASSKPTVDGQNLGTGAKHTNNEVPDANAKGGEIVDISSGAYESDKAGLLEQEEGSSSMLTKLRRRRHTDLHPEYSSSAVMETNKLGGGSKAQGLSATLLAEQKTKKMAELVDSAKVPGMKELFWPIAGRIPFDPAGYLPRSAVKRLARCAGSVVAPFTTYSPHYEVAQAALYHVWRKRVLCCQSYEELLLYVRLLESFLDSTVSGFIIILSDVVGKIL